MLKNIDTKELLKGILCIGSYFLLPTLFFVPLHFFIQKNIIPNTLIIKEIYLYTLLAIFYILIFQKDLKKDYIDIKKNYKQHLKIAFNYWLKGLFIMYASSFLISILGIVENTNQQENINLLKQMPILEFVLATIFAPIIEELVFRKSLRKAFNNIYIYSTITGFIFGFLHVYSSLDNAFTILYLIPYSALGISFGIIYYKTDNIFSSMIIHCLHNFLALTILILGGIFL